MNFKPSWKGYYRSGQRLDIRKLMEYEASFRVDDRVWKRRKQPKKRDYKFTLVIDESSSMAGGRGERAQEALLLFMETLNDLGIDYEIIGFNSAPSYNKEFGGKLTADQRSDVVDEVNRFMGTGATADADALKMAVDGMKKQKGDRRVVIALTDGEGNINTTGMSMKAILEDAEESGIEVIGIGIGEGLDYVQKTYPNRIVISEIDDLPLEIAGLLEHRIIGESMDRPENLSGYIQFDLISPEELPPGEELEKIHGGMKVFGESL